MTGFVAGVFIGGLLVYLIMAALILAKDGWPAKTPKKRETFRDRLKKEHPECVSSIFDGGCKGCPRDYGYESWRDALKACKGTNHDCTACWDREVTSSNELIEKQCRYLEAQAAKIGVDVVVTPNNHGDFNMQLKGSDTYARVSMDDQCETFTLKAWKLLDTEKR